ncbi:hypothetical protein C8Q77DRAFT_1152710 [Trametes polyzona]|nr:hypothetical protein C8Q77DRAFT_1152710 [Trametes polyzona]
MQSYADPTEQYGSEYQHVAYSAGQPSNAYDVPFDYSAAAPWSMHYSYIHPDYVPYQSAPGGVPHEEPVNNGIPLHAPVPISGYSTLLASDAGDPAFAPLSYVEESKPRIVDQANPLDVYLHAPQVLFPTPSELLTDLNAREREARNAGEAGSKAPGQKVSTSSVASRSKAEIEEPENLNQRKAYFRSVSDNVGFTITDPDTITSHDKKRCYLECLEEYTQWLHARLRMYGQEPLPLERISSYRGLKSLSIRTMLVHKQEEIRELNEHKLQEEQRFMDLQNELLMRQEQCGAPPDRRFTRLALGTVPDVSRSSPAGGN